MLKTLAFYKMLGILGWIGGSLVFASVSLYSQLAPKPQPQATNTMYAIPPGPYGPNNNPFVTRCYTGTASDQFIPPPDATTY